MRKKVFAGGMLTAGVFAVGLTAGQLAGIGTTAAAGSPQPRFAAFNSAHRPTGARPPFSLGPRADGTVTTVSRNTITVKAGGNSHGPSPSNEYDAVTTIDLSNTTTYTKGFGQSGSVSDIKVGSFVIAQGTLSSGGKTLTATKVMVAGAGGPGSRPPFSLGPRADGTVTAVSGDTVTVKADGNHGPSPSNEYDSVTTIDLSNSTTYTKGFGQSGSASDIKVGSFVIAQGTLSSDGKTLTATKVMVAGAGRPGGHLGFGPPGGGAGIPGGGPFR